MEPRKIEDGADRPMVNRCTPIVFSGFNNNFVVRRFIGITRPPDESGNYLEKIFIRILGSLPGRL